MTMRTPTAAELENWADLLHHAPGGYVFMQDLLFAQIKGPGWQPRPRVHRVGDREIPVLYLARRMPFFGEFWYAPGGPRVVDESDFDAICRDLMAEADQVFSVVMEPVLPSTQESDKAELCRRIPVLRPEADIQPMNHTVIVDLRPTEDELLASFRQRARRYIRKSAETAVIEHIDDESAFGPMFDLYAEMIERTGFHMRSRDYYENFWRTYLEAGQGHFVLARPAEGEDYAAGAFCLTHGDAAVYKDGGSVRSKESNGLQYLVQWEAMRWAKERGALSYDMLGAPPSWRADDPTHSRHGLVQFKTAFAPIVDHVGAVRLVRQPRMDQAWEKVGRRAWNLKARRTGEQWY